MTTIVDPSAHVDSLDLGDHEPRLRRALLGGATPQMDDDNNSSGYVDDGSLISFVAGLPSQDKSDVLNSLLLAQLAANKAYDREKDTEHWYKSYTDTLTAVGWTGGFNFKKYASSSGSFDMSSVVLEILGAIAFGAEIVAVTATLDALKKLPSKDGRLTLWNSAATSASAGNFQIGTCSHSGGTVVMQIGAFYFSASESFTDVLWFKFASSKVSLYQGASKLVLNESVYAKVRKQIEDKLGDRATTYVANIPI